MRALISTLAIGALLINKTEAAPFHSDLSLKVFNSKPIIVQLDHVDYGRQGSEFSLKQIQPGRHRLTVWSDPSYYHYNSYSAPALLYNGFIDVQPSSKITALITYNNALSIVNVEPVCSIIPYTPCNNSSYNVNPFPGMPATQFNQLKNTIRTKSFDSTKLQLARTAAKNNPLSSTQIADLMSLLNFESSRMELAKFAYRYTIDPQNYFVVYDEFTFDSSVSALSRYIDNHS